MITSEQLIGMYTRTYQIIKRQTADLAHEDTLLQFPSGGNCLNWTLGHITAARTNVLAALGETDTVWNFDQARRYISGSEPITGNTEGVLRLEKILAGLDRTQARLVKVLNGKSPADLETAQGDSTVGATVFFFAIHETYHTGQIELYRHLTGKEGVPGFE